jgi:hypothetical protein
MVIPYIEKIVKTGFLEVPLDRGLAVPDEAMIRTAPRP